MNVDLQLRDLEKRARERSGGRPLPLREWVALAEAWRIADALREARGNRAAAARALGIGRRTLYTKMEKLGLVPVWMVRKDDSTNPTVDERSEFASEPRARLGLARADS